MDKPRISEVADRFLVAAGCSDSVRAQVTMTTRLYHDLGVYGDEAWAYLEALSQDFGVDLSDFEFDVFFPREFPGRTWLERKLSWMFWFLPGVGRAESSRQYRAITLTMIEEAILAGEWGASDPDKDSGAGGR